MVNGRSDLAVVRDDGVLLNLRFASVGTVGSVSWLSLEDFVFNEGQPVSASNGRVELF